MEINIEELRKKYQLSDVEFAKNAQAIFNELSLLTNKSENPKFIIVGGQAGAGKSDLVAKKYQELNGNAIIIDQDELRTKYPQPAYQEITSTYNDRTEFLILNPYIAKMIKSLVSTSREKGYNVIIESALQDVEAFLHYTEEFNNAGYTSEVAVLSVPELEGNISMLYRYCTYLEKDGFCRRNTRINPNAKVNMRNNIQKMDALGIYDNIEIYTRNPDRSKLPDKIYEKKTHIAETPIEAFERGQRISMKETIKNFERKYDYIKNILQRYNETDKLQTLENLYQQYLTLDERE